MAFRFLILTFLVPALGACFAAEAEDPEDDEAALERAMPALVAEDFSAALSKPFIASTHTMAPDRFEVKWVASKSSAPVMFYRAYPGAFHADFVKHLKAEVKTKIPGAVGLCVGDGHPDNFGFLRLEGRVLYAYNDLDDAGYCPVALDALRWVAAVRVFFKDDKLTERAARRYVEVVSGERKRGDALDDIAKIREDAPDFASRKTEKLEELTRGNKLARGAGLLEVPSNVRVAVEAAVRGALEVTPLDVLFVERDAGGSGGLARYWILVERGTAKTVLELKESATPGVELGLGRRELDRKARLELLKKEIWGVESKGDYLSTTVMGKPFLLRDRLAKASLDSAKLGSKAREDLVDAQASFLGLLHKRTFAPEGDAAKAYRRWLAESAPVVADRWLTAFGKRE